MHKKFVPVLIVHVLQLYTWSSEYKSRHSIIIQKCMQQAKVLLPMNAWSSSKLNAQL